MSCGPQSPTRPTCARSSPRWPIGAKLRRSRATTSRRPPSTASRRSQESCAGDLHSRRAVREGGMSLFQRASSFRFEDELLEDDYDATAPPVAAAAAPVPPAPAAPELPGLPVAGAAAEPG